jgi:beta-lactamase class A
VFGYGPGVALICRHRTLVLPCTRRAALCQAALVIASSIVAGEATAAPAGSPRAKEKSSFAALEQRSQGRLGVAIIDTATGKLTGHRSTERFPMCSTFKVLTVAAVLARVDRAEERLDRRIRFGASDLLEYAPVTRARAHEGSLTVAELCEASLVVSDNTAANLLLGTFGGPAALTAYARTLGDTKTRLDRNEPNLNQAVPGDERDTTTPEAMARDLEFLLLGTALSGPSRERLSAWMSASTTGLSRLRAGVPPSWRVADKTGSGLENTTNHVAILWPPERKPIVVAAYLTTTPAPADVRNGVFAELAREITAAG